MNIHTVVKFVVFSLNILLVEITYVKYVDYESQKKTDGFRCHY